jgi:Family of unknown function (DUF6522)
MDEQADRKGPPARMLIRRGIWRLWPLRAAIGGVILSMSEIAIRDGAIEIEASIVAQGLELEPSSIQALMRKGEITSLSEHGVNENAGLHRLTFFHKSRRFRLIIDGSGTIVQRSIINFGDRLLPATVRKPGA